jgi:uncharacterized protein
MGINTDNIETEEKLEKLTEFIKGFRNEGVIVAFSGGVDSSTLAALTARTISRVIAVTANSPTTPMRELREARRIAKEIGIDHAFIEINELEDENFVENTSERCFFCKKNLLEALLKFGKGRGYSIVFEGTNASELKGHRPGYKAIKSFKNVYSPWAEFGITKDEIREIAKEMGFSFYNKPSIACLASRIPFGISIDETRLKMVDEAENTVLEITGVTQVRVRNFDGTAVIEVEREGIKKFLNKTDEIAEKLKEIGFKRILLDLEGYRTGKLSSLGNPLYP